MNRKGTSIKEIHQDYGIDVSTFSKSGYYINEETETLVIFDKSKIAFEGPVKPKDAIYGSFSDTYFYYFAKLKEE
jgi:hypothetical protein